MKDIKTPGGESCNNLSPGRFFSRHFQKDAKTLPKCPAFKLSYKIRNHGSSVAEIHNTPLGTLARIPPNLVKIRFLIIVRLRGRFVGHPEIDIEVATISRR